MAARTITLSEHFIIVLGFPVLNFSLQIRDFKSCIYPLDGRLYRVCLAFSFLRVSHTYHSPEKSIFDHLRRIRICKWLPVGDVDKKIFPVVQVTVSVIALGINTDMVPLTPLTTRWRWRLYRCEINFINIEIMLSLILGEWPFLVASIPWPRTPLFLDLGQTLHPVRAISWLCPTDLMVTISMATIKPNSPAWCVA